MMWCLSRMMNGIYMSYHDGRIIIELIFSNSTCKKHVIKISDIEEPLPLVTRTVNKHRDILLLNKQLTMNLDI